MAKAYHDPTADRAIGKIMREERIRKKMFKDAVHRMAAVCGYRIHIEFIRSDNNDHNQS